LQKQMLLHNYTSPLLGKALSAHFAEANAATQLHFSSFGKSLSIHLAEANAAS